MQQRHGVTVSELHAQRLRDVQLHYVALYLAVSYAVLYSVSDRVRDCDAVAVLVVLSERVGERLGHAVRHWHAERQPQRVRLLLRHCLSLGV